MKNLHYISQLGKLMVCRCGHSSKLTVINHSNFPRMEFSVCPRCQFAPSVCEICKGFGSQTTYEEMETSSAMYFDSGGNPQSSRSYSREGTLTPCLQCSEIGLQGAYFTTSNKQPCSRCEGHGRRACDGCRGKKWRRKLVVFRRLCTDCDDNGTTICSSCEGTGKKRNLSFYEPDIRISQDVIDKMKLPFPKPRRKKGDPLFVYKDGKWVGFEDA